jgi:hypothetical protein
MTVMAQWYPEYQNRDRDIVDYQQFLVPGCDVKFRGPGFDPFAVPSGSYFTCLGAAQTYGCYYEHPFPALLANRIGLSSLNLGVGGAGPGFYLQYPALIDTMNRGSFVILQCMAARHETNSRFEADGYVEFVRDRVSGDRVDSGTAWRRIIDEEFEKAADYVAQSRASWLDTTRKLLDAITVPVVFFWFSRREPDYTIDWQEIAEQRERRLRGEYTGHFIDGLSGDFPHYVDGPSARAAAALCEAEAKCLSQRGMSAAIINRWTGEPLDPAKYEGLGPEYQALRTGRNDYYPSAQMHEDATDALEPVVRRFL